MKPPSDMGVIVIDSTLLSIIIDWPDQTMK